VALAPEVILANGTSVVAPLLQATRTLPVVFGTVVDPVGAGFVASLARPGGNATGFTAFEYGMSGKWPELLRQIAPPTTRAAVLRGRSVASGSAQFGAISVYPYVHFVTGGGLVSYGPDYVDQFRRATSYVDRILKGEKPADLRCSPAPTRGSNKHSFPPL